MRQRSKPPNPALATEIDMFYSDFGVRHYATHFSNYILRFVSHFDQYVNGRFVRTVSYDDVVWC